MVSIRNWQILKQVSLKGSFLSPLLFLIYLNDLHDNLILNPKLFTNDTSLFSVIDDKSSSASKLNQDLNRINH